jgi:hypothetical protein
MTNATVFAGCVQASAVVTACRALARAVRVVSRLLPALAHFPLGGFAKRADYIAIASSLSPPE